MLIDLYETWCGVSKWNDSPFILSYRFEHAYRLVCWSVGQSVCLSTCNLQAVCQRQLKSQNTRLIYISIFLFPFSIFYSMLYSIIFVTVYSYIHRFWGAHILNYIVFYDDVAIHNWYHFATSFWRGRLCAMILNSKCEK